MTATCILPERPDLAAEWVAACVVPEWLDFTVELVTPWCGDAFWWVALAVCITPGPLDLIAEPVTPSCVVFWWVVPEWLDLVTVWDVPTGDEVA